MATQQNPQLEGKLVNTVHDEVQLRPSFIVLLIFSTIIATLGLLVNNTAVVIGAMLITPLFWPIAGVTIGLITTKRRLARKALITLLISLVAVFIISFVVAWLAPFTEVSPEIELRTNPTLIDLFIALTTAVIAMIALYYPRISQTAIGVAISITLLPALCVAGIGVAFGSMEMFLGAMLLFGTNMAAIIFAGVITLYVLNVRPHRQEEETRLKIGFVTSLVVVIALSVPLSIYLGDSIQHASISRSVRTELTEQVENIEGKTSVDEILIAFPAARANEVDVNATVFFSEGEFITQAQQNTIVDALAAVSGRTVNLQLNVLNTVLARQQEDEEKRSQKDTVRNLVVSEIEAMNPDAEIEQVDVQFADDLGVAAPMIQVTVVMKEVNDESPLTFQQKEDLRQVLLENTDTSDLRLTVELEPVRYVTENAQEQLEERITLVVQEEVESIASDGFVHSLDYRFNEETGVAQVEIVVFMPSFSGISVVDEQRIEEVLRTELNNNATTNVNIRVVEFTTPSQTDESAD